MQVHFGGAVVPFGGGTEIVEQLKSFGFSGNLQYESWMLVDAHVLRVSQLVAEKGTLWILSPAYLPTAIGMPFGIGIISVVGQRQTQVTRGQWCSLGVVSSCNECSLSKFLIAHVVINQGNGAFLPDKVVALDGIVSTVCDVESGLELWMPASELLQIERELVSLKAIPGCCGTGDGEFQPQLGFDGEGGDGVISEYHLGFAGMGTGTSESTLRLGIGRQPGTAYGRRLQSGSSDLECFQWEGEHLHRDVVGLQQRLHSEQPDQTLCFL